MVDDDVMCVDLVLSEFLDEPFCLVERKEFGYADADKGRLVLLDLSALSLLK